MNINFDWDYPKILEPVFDFNGRYILLKGGRSSGKSVFIAHLLLEKALCYKNDILCCREFQKSIEQSNYKLFKKLIEKYKLPFVLFDKKIKSKTTDSEIIFTGLSDQTSDGLKSYEGFKYVWIEEGQRISRKSWEILDPTIRVEDAQIFVSMNPEVPDDENPITNDLTTAKKHNALIIHINYLDNPFCPSNILEMAELTRVNKPDDYNRIWLGLPDDRQNSKVVKNFTNDNIKSLYYMPDLPLHLSCDFNVDPMSWVVAHKTRDKVYYIDELVIENTSTKGAIQEFIERYKDHKGDIIVNGDASGDYRSAQSDLTNYVIIRNELQKHFKRKIKINIRHFNPPIKSRVNAFNEMILDIEGKRRIFISPQCEWLIYNCKQFRYKEGTTQFDLPTHIQIRNDKQLKFLGHIFDAASYLIDFYFPIKNEKSFNFNAN